MPGRRRGSEHSESVDNYLKAIFSIGGPQASRVTSTALADRLNVAPASVTNMLQKLAAAAEPMIEYERHRGVRLSDAGRKRALEVVRHHRLIETFLYEVLDYPIEEVHAEAERLEHFISERFEERIAAKLGHPVIDPHGHQIPTLDGRVQTRDSVRLTKVGGGGTFVVDSVDDRDVATLRTLEAHGIKTGVVLQVEARSAQHSYCLCVGGSYASIDLPAEMAEDIWILPVEEQSLRSARTGDGVSHTA